MTTDERDAAAYRILTGMFRRLRQEGPHVALFAMLDAWAEARAAGITSEAEEAANDEGTSA